MFRGHHHIRCTEQGVRASREHADDIVSPIEFKIDLGANALANPIGLQFLDRVGPVQFFQSVQQPFGKFGDPQHPLPHRFADDRMSAAFAHAADDFFVGQHGSQCRAPVDRGFVLIGQPVVVDVLFLFGIAQTIRDGQFIDRASLLLVLVEPAVEEFQKDPLRPFDIVNVGGVDLAVPVVGKAQRLNLPPHVVDVLFRGDGRVGAGLDGVLLRRQPERVPAHRVQHVKAGHPFVPADNIAGRVALRVPHMQPGPGRVGEHIQHIVLGLVGIVGCGEGLIGKPEILPFLLNTVKIVLSVSSWFSHANLDKSLISIMLDILKPLLYRFSPKGQAGTGWTIFDPPSLFELWRDKWTLDEIAAYALCSGFCGQGGD